MRGEIIDKEASGDVVTRDEQLPVTGAASTVPALAATLGLATGAGMLRTSRQVAVAHRHLPVAPSWWCRPGSLPSRPRSCQARPTTFVLA